MTVLAPIALAASLASFEAGMAALALALATKQLPPGDAPEDHEDNDFGLPEGAPIRKAFRRFAREQLRHVLAAIPGRADAPIPDRFPRMADYDDAMASAFTPILSAYWDRSGKGLRGRLGLDPADWRVTDPNVHRAIAGQALKFCARTNATTDRSVAEAADGLRDQLHRGLVGEGQAIPELTARVRTVFTRLSRDGARRIAQTEASRAVHAAALMSAEQSGVVRGQRWLVSAHSCPICHSLAEKAEVALGEAFGSVGRDPDYSTIKFPPAHPHCRCSTVMILIDDDAPPVPAFEPNASAPDEEVPARGRGNPKSPATPARRHAGMPEPRKAGRAATAIPAPDVGFKSAGSGGPILPDAPIGERIGAYARSVGDAKLAAIRRAAEGPRVDLEDANAKASLLRVELRGLIGDLYAERTDAESEAARGRLGPLRAREAELRAAIKAEESRSSYASYLIRDAVRESLQVDRPAKIAILHVDPPAAEGRLIPPGEECSGTINKAVGWLHGSIRRGKSGKFPVAFGELAGGGRACCDVRDVVIELDRKDDPGTVIHELGHALESNLHDGKGWAEHASGGPARKFLEYRVGDERASKFRKVIGRGYDADEAGRKDRFDEAFGPKLAWYVGKHYDDATEILAMGLEKLYRDPLTLIEKDPEFANFLLGVLDGSLR